MSSGSPVRMSWPRRTAQTTRCASTTSDVVVCARRQPTGRPSSNGWTAIAPRKRARRAWRGPFRQTCATTGCVVCSAVPDRSAALRNVWAAVSLRSMEMRRPASRITVRIGSPSQRHPRHRLALHRHPNRQEMCATLIACGGRPPDCGSLDGSRLTARRTLGRACRGALRPRHRGVPSSYSSRECSTVVLHTRRSGRWRQHRRRAPRRPG